MNKYQFSFLKLVKEQEIESYALKKLRPLQVRKLNRLNRYIVDTIADLFESYSIKGDDLDFVLTSSFHGELATSCQIIDDIVDGKTPSPTLFSQSTHNVCAGLLGSMLKVKAPSSSICAGEKSFVVGVENLFRFLNIGRYENSLYIYHEQRSPEEFKQAGVDQPTTAFIMLVEKSDVDEKGWLVSRQKIRNDSLDLDEVFQSIVSKKPFGVGQLSFEYV